MPNFQEKFYANALNQLPFLGPVRIAKLYKISGTFMAAWHNLPVLIEQIKLNSGEREQIITTYTKTDPEQECNKLQEHKIELLLFNEEKYPELLKEISAPPPVLYTKGDQNCLSSFCVGVVGTRKISHYGRQVADEIVSGLVSASITVVSGLAFGIDAAALNTACELQSPCIAVLASSLDNQSISPRSNFELSQKIIKHGCLVSEYPLNSETQKQNFPMRNRIISGLSKGVLVIEAAEKSGALITANYALEQNREVFAVPGSIFSLTSVGANRLIQQGAKLVLSYEDILRELNLDMEVTPAINSYFALDEFEKSILSTLTKIPMHLDELVRTTTYKASDVIPKLVLLELKGLVKNMGGSNYVKIK